MELLIGCGNSREKKITFNEIKPEWTELITLDIDETCHPDVIHDLNVMPLPFEGNTFDEIHAYEVLEHCGKQGDWRFFFDQFMEFWRILKPGGFFVGSCPMWDSPWAWSDPGHTRLISAEMLTFLSQKEYEAQIGKTAMTDYRSYYMADFDPYAKQENDHNYAFVLKAIKHAD